MGRTTMSKNFIELKKQLNELSETINKFDSEAVQLRIVELLFDQSGPNPGMAEAGAGYDAGPGMDDVFTQRAGSHAQTRGRNKRGDSAAPSASGAVAALASLVEGDFFEENRTIGDVVRKCEEDYGVRYQSNAFSGPLSRYAASGVLKREKNEEGKFAYHK